MPTTYNNTGAYLGLSFLFLGFIILVVVAYFYAKWHIYGPKWRKFIAKWKKNPDGSGTSKSKSQRGAKISSDEMTTSVEESDNIQEMLRTQIEEEKAVKVTQQKQKEEAEKAKTAKWYQFGKKKQIKKDEKAAKEAAEKTNADSLSNLLKNEKKGLDWGVDTNTATETTPTITLDSKDLEAIEQVEEKLDKENEEK